MHNFSIARYKGFTVNAVYVHMVYILKKPLNIMHYPVFDKCTGRSYYGA